MIGEADKRRFAEQGYLLLEGVVPERLCAPVRDCICEFLDMRADRPASWPRRQSRGHGIVPVHHAQPLWDLRQHPPVHQAFAALHGTDALWVSFDRVSCKTPDPTRLPGIAEPFHWDGHPGRLTGLSLQGLVYLADTEADQGAFCCVPGIFRDLDRVLAEQPDAADSRRPVTDGFPTTPVPGAAGSLLLWHRLLPHSSMRNVSNRPRWVQYVAMDPEGTGAERIQRIAQYRERRPPQWAVAQKVPGQQIPEPGAHAELSLLGRRLVGLERWPATRTTMETCVEHSPTGHHA